jgi:hypothetical protein
MQTNIYINWTIIYWFSSMKIWKIRNNQPIDSGVDYIKNKDRLLFPLVNITSGHEGSRVLVMIFIIIFLAYEYKKDTCQYNKLICYTC